MSKARQQRFTGRHMTLIMMAFFGVVISVNVTMAIFASRTFGGKVVENSYVATQRFNGWLEKARAQEQLGWNETVQLDQERRIELDVTASGGPLGGARILAEARHPVGRADDISLAFAEVGAGRYRSLDALPHGRWQIHLTINSGGAEKRLIEVLQ